MIPGQVHAEDVPGSVGLAADAAGVREAVDVCLHVLLELALVVGRLPAHPARPHALRLDQDVLDLLIQLRIDLDEVLRHIVWIILDCDHLLAPSFSFILFSWVLLF